MKKRMRGKEVNTYMALWIRKKKKTRKNGIYHIYCRDV